ncbi:MAG TPA: DUF2867 domain-containing protein [Solirubrobacteraceae bacterium]|nr:DUF2867 domain-containing protein [Solirubrobacteraceae bacterium]
MNETQPSRVLAPTVSEIPLPPDARALSTLSRIDYADAFTVVGAATRTPQQWLSATVQEAPRRVRRRLVLGWTALGLKLGPPWSANRVLGWKVEHSDPAFVLLAADSWLGFRGQLLFRREPDGLLFATFVEQTNPAARAVWAVITPHHRHVVRSLLAHAASRERTR